jgi:HEAT repeat protein
MTKSNPASTWIAALAFAGLILATPTLCAQDPTPLLTRSEDKLLPALQPNTSEKEKADACRELAVVGTRAAIPPLVALLNDPHIGHMARYALETIPDPGVNEALRAQLDKLTGRALVGVIGSLGVRRDPAAVPPLTALLGNADPDVAQAAARALGKIGNVPATQALQAALPKASPANQLAFCEGLFRCAETLVRTDRPTALAAYATLRALATTPHQVRAGALRGTLLAQGNQGLPLLRESLRGDDYILTAAAARAALELPGKDVTTALLAEFDTLNTDKQVLVIQIFGRRADVAALPRLGRAAREGDKTVRLAALRAIPEIGTPAAGPRLAALLQDPDKDLAQAARDGLAGLPGAEAEAAIVSLLAANNTPDRLVAVDLVGRRRMSACVPALFKAATDPDAQLRPAATKRLADLAKLADLPALLDLVVKAATPADRDAAEEAVSAVCARANDPAALGQVIGRLAPATPAAKAALLRILTTLGGPEALKAVRTAVQDSDADVRGTALRALGSWKTADAAPDLLDLARKATTTTEKMLCLRGYLGWVSNPDTPLAQRLAMIRDAAALAQQTEEKKLLLGALGSIKSPDALKLADPYLDDPATKNEAAAAAIAIAEEVLKTPDAAKVAAQLVATLQKAAAAPNADLARRAQSLADQAKNKK